MFVADKSPETHRSESCKDGMWADEKRYRANMPPLRGSKRACSMSELQTYHSYGAKDETFRSTDSATLLLCCLLLCCLLLCYPLLCYPLLCYPATLLLVIISRIFEHFFPFLRTLIEYIFSSPFISDNIFPEGFAEDIQQFAIFRNIPEILHDVH